MTFYRQERQDTPRKNLKQNLPVKNMTENEIGKIVVDSAIKVHKILGPGLLESAYEACLIHELKKRDLNVNSQVGLPVEYEDVVLDVGYRLDVFINKKRQEK